MSHKNRQNRDADTSRREFASEDRWFDEGGRNENYGENQGRRNRSSSYGSEEGQFAREADGASYSGSRYGEQRYQPNYGNEGMRTGRSNSGNYEGGHFENGGYDRGGSNRGNREMNDFESGYRGSASRGSYGQEQSGNFGSGGYGGGSQYGGRGQYGSSYGGHSGYSSSQSSPMSGSGSMSNCPECGCNLHQHQHQQGQQSMGYTGQGQFGGQQFQRGPSGIQSQSGMQGFQPQESRGQFGQGSQFQGGPWQKRASGKGPKGYKRSDERIREDINDRLSDGMIDASNITVNVKDGEVTLTGTVDSRQVKFHAESMAECVPGVSDVINQLRVVSENTSSGSGTDSGQTSSSGKSNYGEKSTQNKATSSSMAGTRS